MGTSMFAQSQWKFHIAFEDATGARDTIWCIWDSTAHGTLPIDTGLGEGPINMNYGNFNVYIGNANSDTTKTAALPFNGTFGLQVWGINYQYPLTISWDSSLLSNIFQFPFASIDVAKIYNDYFFGINNDPPLQAFNMLLADYVSAPYFNWGTQSQFPMSFQIARHDTSYVKVDNFLKEKLNVFPNPAKNVVSIWSPQVIKTIELYTSNGIKLFSTSYFEPATSRNISIGNFIPGFYVIEIITMENKIYFEKIIKIP